MIPVKLNRNDTADLDNLCREYKSQYDDKNTVEQIRSSMQDAIDHLEGSLGLSILPSEYIWTLWYYPSRYHNRLNIPNRNFMEGLDLRIVDSEGNQEHILANDKKGFRVWDLEYDSIYYITMRKGFAWPSIPDGGRMEIRYRAYFEDGIPKEIKEALFKFVNHRLDVDWPIGGYLPKDLYIGLGDYVSSVSRLTRVF